MSGYDFSGPSSRPDPNCRSCTDFKSWSKQNNPLFTNAKVRLSVIYFLFVFSRNLVFQGKVPEKPVRKDCPLDKNELGKASWGLLHTMAAHYPDNPTQKNKTDVKTFFDTFSRLYPCEWCAKDFQEE